MLTELYCLLGLFGQFRTNWENSPRILLTASAGYGILIFVAAKRALMQSATASFASGFESDFRLTEYQVLPRYS